MNIAINNSETCRSNSPQLILLSVDRLKLLMTYWIIQKFKQFINIVIFNVFFYGSPNIRLNLRTLNELLNIFSFYIKKNICAKMINDHFWGMISTGSEIQSAASRKRVFANTRNIRFLTKSVRGEYVSYCLRVRPFGVCCSKGD